MRWPGLTLSKSAHVNALFVPGYQLILTLIDTDNMISKVPDRSLTKAPHCCEAGDAECAGGHWQLRLPRWRWGVLLRLGRHHSLTFADTLSNQTRRCAPSHHKHILHCFPYTFHLSSFISSFIRLENEALEVTCLYFREFEVFMINMKQLKHSE